jgi:carbonic anhydrase
LSRFDEILERNRHLTAGRRAEPLAPPESVSLIIVTCFDPRLDPLFQVLGLEAGEAFWFRTAGAFVPRASSTLRALIVAVFLLDVREIVVVGHSSCRMASFDSSSFIDAFRKRGVAREAFGTHDLRDWAGAIPNPRRGVELSVQNILAEPVRPKELPVFGAVLDDTSAVLSPVSITSASVAEPSPREAEPPREPETPAVPSVAPPLPLDVIRAALLESTRWRDEVTELRARLRRETSNFVKLRILTSFLRKVGAESQDVLQAFELLKKQIHPSSNPTVEAEKLVRLLERMLHEP